MKTLYSNFIFFWICFSYEAWVIYNFLSLCLAWVGGPGAVVLSLSGRVLKPSVCLMTCCLPPVPLDGWVYLYIYFFFWHSESIEILSFLITWKLQLFILFGSGWWVIWILWGLYVIPEPFSVIFGLFLFFLIYLVQ